jgi:subtilisin-like proprotein convertase family protein
VFEAVVRVGLLAALASGCSLQVSYESSSYTCEANTACPDGFVCAGGTCLLARDLADAAAPPADADLDPRTQTWRDDSFADFDGTRDHVTVSARGALEPFAYYTGGLRLRAADDGTLANPSTLTWDHVESLELTDTIGVSRSMDVNWHGNIPAGVGLTNPDFFTVIGEGEIFLETGAWTFEYGADDDGILEIAGPTGFERVVNSTRAFVEGRFTATQSGWYPIRLAASDNAGNSLLRLRFKGPGVDNLTVVPRHRLRARVDDLTGLVHHGFADQYLVGDGASAIDADRPAQIDWAGGQPLDLGVGLDNFSNRWTGQFLVVVGGDYRFRYSSDDGQRLWIDGQRHSDQWVGGVQGSETPTMNLAPGWHSLVVDHYEVNGPAHAELTVLEGPELVGEPLPVERLRPVEPRFDRFESGTAHGTGNIPECCSVVLVRGIQLAAPPGAKVTGIDVSFDIDHPSPTDLNVQLLAPGGQSVTLKDRTSGNGRGYFRTTGLNGLEVSGNWLIRIHDQVEGNTGVLEDFELTVHHDRGEAPIATNAGYESPVRELGRAVSIDRVSWDASAPAGSQVEVQLRSCAELADCADAAWVAVDNGAVPSVVAKRYLQYRVGFVSDGDAAPALEAIAIDYTVDP